MYATAQNYNISCSQPHIASYVLEWVDALSISSHALNYKKAFHYRIFLTSPNIPHTWPDTITIKQVAKAFACVLRTSVGVKYQAVWWLA